MRMPGGLHVGLLLVMVDLVNLLLYAGRSGLVVACLAVVWEDLGSNLTLALALNQNLTSCSISLLIVTTPNVDGHFR